MPPRNPSELQRLEEERQELLHCLIKQTPVKLAFRGVWDKGQKGWREELLRQLREIERQLGVEHVPFNSSEFGEQLK
jgi:hypothetical protein